METIAGFEVYPVEFTRLGRVFDEGQVQALLDRANQGATDVLIVCHGWNNNKDEARALYRSLLTSVRSLLPPGSDFTQDRTLIVMAVYWPSKRFAERDLIPGGGAASAGDVDAEISRLVAELIDSYQGGEGQPEEIAVLQAVQGLVPRLEDSEGTQEDFVRLLRSIFPADVNSEEDVLQDSFYTSSGRDLLLKLGRPFRPRTLAVGGVTAVDEASAALAAGGAAGLGNLFGGIKNGALNFLNLFTYYEMKERAGMVGSKGVRSVMQRLGSLASPPRLHLCGHSFGGRVVSAALGTGSDLSPVPVHSVVLLQAAFSHWGFARHYDGSRDGLFRGGLGQATLKGPVLVTYTANDRAVGLAYPIASRLRNQVASGIGDKNDPYGGIGRNGAQRTPEVSDSEQALRGTGSAYGTLKAGTIYNLEASKFIPDHGSVHGPEVAQALLSAMRASA